MRKRVVFARNRGPSSEKELTSADFQTDTFSSAVPRRTIWENHEFPPPVCIGALCLGAGTVRALVLRCWKLGVLNLFPRSEIVL